MFNLLNFDWLLPLSNFNKSSSTGQDFYVKSKFIVHQIGHIVYIDPFTYTINRFSIAGWWLIICHRHYPVVVLYNCGQ